MNFTVVLEDEKGNVVRILDQEFKTGLDLSHFALLRYLDPYGDTVFNKNQMNDLITDLKILSDSSAHPLIEEIIELAERCKNTVHNYLCFYGD